MGVGARLDLLRAESMNVGVKGEIGALLKIVPLDFDGFNSLTLEYCILVCVRKMVAIARFRLNSLLKWT